jgi:hypothetical protein
LAKKRNKTSRSGHSFGPAPEFGAQFAHFGDSDGSPWPERWVQLIMFAKTKFALYSMKTRYFSQSAQFTVDSLFAYLYYLPQTAWIDSSWNLQGIRMAARPQRNERPFPTGPVTPLRTTSFEKFGSQARG